MGNRNLWGKKGGGSFLLCSSNMTEKTIGRICRQQRRTGDRGGCRRQVSVFMEEQVSSSRQGDEGHCASGGRGLRLSVLPGPLYGAVGQLWGPLGGYNSLPQLRRSRLSA